MISLVITESADIKFNSNYGLIQLKPQFDIDTIFKISYTSSLYVRPFLSILGLAKLRATQLKPEKIRIGELSYQTGKFYTEALLQVLSKAIA